MRKSPPWFTRRPVAAAAVFTLAAVAVSVPPPARAGGAGENELLPEEVSIAGWSNETVESKFNVGYYSGVGYAADGKPSIAYSDETRDRLKYAHWNGTKWAIQIADPGPDINDLSLAFDPATGYPAIAYGDHALKVSRWNGSSWIRTVVDPGANGGARKLLRFGPDGEPWISYSVRINNVPTFSLKVAHLTGAAWTIETVDAAGGQDSSIGFTPAGEAAVAYQAKAAVGSGVKYAVKSGTSWTGEWIESGVQGYGVSVSLGFDASGFPAVAHGNSTATGGVRFLQKTATGWGTAQLLTDSQGSSSRLVFDAQGTPWVVLDYGFDLQLLHRTSTGWITETVLAAGDCGRADLAFDAADKPAISMGCWPARDMHFARRTP
jgi:hypothetical protein